jgi:membrane-bound ClpP family serine protease
MNTRLIVALISSLIDEVIIVVVIIWGLPHWGIRIPVWGMVLICLGFGGYAYLTFRLGSRILKKKPIPGFTDMIGMSGTVVEPLHPAGMVRVNSELWEARVEQGEVTLGVEVEVISQDGMKLVVRAKKKGSDQQGGARDA